MKKKFEFTIEEQNIIEKAVKENRICIAHDDNIAKDDMLIEIGKRISDLENNNGKILYVLPNVKKARRYNERYNVEKEKYNMVFEHYGYLRECKDKKYNEIEHNDILAIIIDSVENTARLRNGDITVQLIYDYYIQVKKVNPKVRIYLTYCYFMADTVVDLYAVSLILNRSWMRINSLYEAEDWGKFFWNTKENDTRDIRRNKFQIFHNVNIITNIIDKFVIYDEFELLKKIDLDMKIKTIEKNNCETEEKVMNEIMSKVKKNINEGLQVIFLKNKQFFRDDDRALINFDYDYDMLYKYIERIGLSNDEVIIYLEKKNDKHYKKNTKLINEKTKLVIYNSKRFENELYRNEKIEFANFYYMGDDIMCKFSDFLDFIKLLCKNCEIPNKKLYLYVDKGNYKSDIDGLRQKYNFIKNVKVKNSEVLIDILEKYVKIVDATNDIDFKADYQNFLEQQAKINSNN